MCRSIVTLRGAEPPTPEEVRAAALQFVRKISGYRAPSQANHDAFEQAVVEIAESTQTMLDRLVSRPAMRAKREVARQPGS